VTSLNQYILHCDLDEFPQRETFQRAWEELHSPANTCDAVVAQWADRIADGGRLTKVKASSTSGSVEEQFPLRCELSNQFVGGARTSKALIYRAPFRVDGGQHEVWCDRDGFTQQEKRAMIQEGVTDYKDAGPDKPWNRVRACNRHIEARRKTRDRRVIMKHLVHVPYRPRYCKHEVQMDHYKWFDGILAYLVTRATDYRKKGLHWWLDSRDLLMNIQNHNGKICVNCRGSQCVDTRTNTSVPADPFGVFFSRRDSYGKASWSKVLGLFGLYGADVL
jgi:hypothetical protein